MAYWVNEEACPHGCLGMATVVQSGPWEVGLRGYLYGGIKSIFSFFDPRPGLGKNLHLVFHTNNVYLLCLQAKGKCL
jgi:hypothetical protein